MGRKCAFTAKVLMLRGKGDKSSWDHRKGKTRPPGREVCRRIWERSNCLYVRGRTQRRRLVVGRAHSVVPTSRRGRRSARGCGARAFDVAGDAKRTALLA